MYLYTLGVEINLHFRCLDAANERLNSGVSSFVFTLVGTMEQCVLVVKENYAAPGSQRE